MPAGLKGEARRTLMRLNGAYARAIAETKTHLKDCYPCKRAGVTVYERCDRGWELAKLETRTRNELNRYKTDHPDTQEQLWTT